MKARPVAPSSAGAPRARKRLPPGGGPPHGALRAGPGLVLSDPVPGGRKTRPLPSIPAPRTWRYAAAAYAARAAETASRTTADASCMLGSRARAAAPMLTVAARPRRARPPNHRGLPPTPLVLSSAALGPPPERGPRKLVGRGPFSALRAPESWSVAAVSPHSRDGGRDHVAR